MRERYTMWDEIRRMQEQMDTLFNNFFSNDPFMERNRQLLEYSGAGKKGELVTSNYKQPLSDIYETDKEIIVEVEMPGVDKKDIQVFVNNDGIDIKAETKTETKEEDKKRGMYRFERNYSGFYRHFSLPNNADANKANAEYKNGILKINIPKLKIGEQKKKLIDVK
ncbi:MAG: Hsp20/alpha crystallin family protein [Candidatus Woesearchaeota archaeon]